MQIDLAVAPTCEHTKDCGLAQACKRAWCGPGQEPDAQCWRCLPCETDGECASGEVCVLDHCVKSNLAECRSSKDCPGVHCVLNGYSTGDRNNDEMRAYCIDPEGGRPTPPEADVPTVDDRPPTVLDSLHRQIEETLGSKE